MALNASSQSNKKILLCLPFFVLFIKIRTMKSLFAIEFSVLAFCCCCCFRRVYIVDVVFVCFLKKYWILNSRNLIFGINRAFEVLGVFRIIFDD